MKTSLFDYQLPPNRIAQHPMEPREAAKLLVLDRTTGAIQDAHIKDLPTFFHRGDLLIFNDSKVFKARLKATQQHTGKTFELFLLRPSQDAWIALAKKSRLLHEGDIAILSDGTPFVLERKNADGTVIVKFKKSVEEIFALTDRIGEVPLPPYIGESIGASEYQTIYARERGSVAAPTAGFHFTPKIFEVLDQKEIQRAFVTLHVGLGTFRPMKTETLEEHEMHEEWASVPPETLHAIRETKKKGGRVIAVGTTAVRALESKLAEPGFTKLFITPGYSFHVIDGLLTNFHLPKSTLIVLVSSFTGRENILRAYQHAIQHGYRFYSFGDAMLIL